MNDSITRRAALAAFVAVGAGAALPARSQGRDADPSVRHDSSPYVPTPQKVVDEMLRMGRVGRDDYLVDLGSGDGRIVITAAQRFGTRGLGVDLDGQLVRQATAAAERAGVADRAQFVQRDIFKTDLRKADVVTMYLLPEVNMMARPKLLSELRVGARVVTHDYHFDDWLPDERIMLEVPEKKVGTPGIAYVYAWVIPAAGAGRWRGEVAVGGRRQPLELDLEQRFQLLTGSASVGGRPAKVMFAEMDGSEMKVILALAAGAGAGAARMELRGQMRGEEVVGTVRVGNDPASARDGWKAVCEQRRAPFMGAAAGAR
jgi:hypothetical protein